MINIRKRGNVYQYGFEVEKVNGKRKQITKCGFRTKNEAFIAGQKAYNEFINGGIKKESEMFYSDYLDYKCPKRGIITELIVTSKIKSNGIGKELIDKMENYFRDNNCEYVLVDVFAYNENAINFYERKGYHPRMHTDIKKL